MEHDLIAKWKSKAGEVFEKLGFTPIYIGLEKNYERKGEYHKLTFLIAFNCFVIEWASSYEEACMNVYEDTDLLPSFALGEKEVLLELENTLIKYYMD